jgi:hypothetical protein
MGISEGLVVGYRGAEVALIFREGDFTIHSLDNFIVFDLLMNGKFG